MISYTDLFGAQRSQLVPAAAISDMRSAIGAGFAGFGPRGSILTPAHPDLFVFPDAIRSSSFPWKPGVAWVPAVPAIGVDGWLPDPDAVVLKRLIDKAEVGRRCA